MATPCLVLSDDLLDSSRIAGHARAAGLEAVTCRDSAALLAALDRRPALALLDLHNPGLRGRDGRAGVTGGGCASDRIRLARRRRPAEGGAGGRLRRGIAAECVL